MLVFKRPLIAPLIVSAVVDAVCETEILVVVPLVRENLLPVMRPVLSMVKRVEVTPAAVVEPIAKRYGLLIVLEAWIESCAKGVVEASPRLPTVESKKRPASPALPKRIVEDA